jgi:chemotaxis protein methyltransferase CheR
MAALIDALATNHTSFHRESDHFDFLRREAHSLFRPNQPVEIWSAGCATGEEVWTLLFLLNDLFPGRTVRVIGTDISRKALTTAMRGLYPAEKFASLPAAWRSRYCVADPRDTNLFGPRPEIRAMAEFRRLNLVAPLAWPRRFRVIFCRNVMIYFDSNTQEEVARKLAGFLEPGGHLFIGHAESLARCRTPLEYVQPAVYRRPTKGERGWSRSS